MGCLSGAPVGCVCVCVCLCVCVCVCVGWHLLLGRKWPLKPHHDKSWSHQSRQPTGACPRDITHTNTPTHTHTHTPLRNMVQVFFFRFFPGFLANAFACVLRVCICVRVCVCACKCMCVCVGA